ncbi:TPA: hypothetical protein JW587_003712 [Escherichia coli]|nr:hypothetical protein [Escherichia coli]
MTTNEFKSFAISPGSNVISQGDWESLPARASGFQSGKASSAQINKAIRQSSFIASAIAQYVANNTNQDILDNGDVTAFLTKFTNSLGVQLLSRTNPFGDIKADGDVALGQALSNLGLTGDFISGVTRNSYLIIPVKYPATVTHIIIQFGVVNVVANTDTTVPFPIPFPGGGTVLIPVAAYSPGSGVVNTVGGIISGNNAIFRSAASTTINWVAIGA